jgi:hypothetical protein
MQIFRRIHEDGIAPFLTYALDLYHAIMSTLFSPIHIAAAAALASLGSILHFSVVLTGEWHDYFVLFFLAVAADSEAERRSQRNTRWPLFATGTLIALVSTIAADASRSLGASSLASASLVVGGYILYSIVRSVLLGWKHPSPDLSRWTVLHLLYRFSFGEMLIGIVALMTGQLAAQASISETGLVAFLTFMLLVGARNIVQSEAFVFFHALRRREAPKWFSLRTGRFGLQVLAVLSGAAAIFLGFSL